MFDNVRYKSLEVIQRVAKRKSGLRPPAFQVSPQSCRHTFEFSPMLKSTVEWELFDFVHA